MIILILYINLLHFSWIKKVSIFEEYGAFKMLITTTAADTEMFYASEKIRLDILCELSAYQMIHMQCQV